MIVDDGEIATPVRAIVPAGVEVALELVGTPTLPDTLRATAIHGVVCFTGMLSNEWTVRDFYPIGYLPRACGSPPTAARPADLPAAVLQSFLDAVAAGRLTVPLHRTYTLDEIATAHADMEAGNATGKLVVLPRAAERAMEKRLHANIDLCDVSGPVPLLLPCPRRADLGPGGR